LKYEINEANYKKLHKVFLWETHDKRFTEDLLQDYYLKILEGKTTGFVYQFVARYEQKYYGCVDLHQRKTKDDPTLRYSDIVEATVEADLDTLKTVSEIKEIAKVLSRKNIDEMLELYLKGYNYSEIGDELGYTKQGVGKVMKILMNRCEKVLDLG